MDSLFIEGQGKTLRYLLSWKEGGKIGGMFCLYKDRTETRRLISHGSTFCQDIIIFFGKIREMMKRTHPLQALSPKSTDELAALRIDRSNWLAGVDYAEGRKPEYQEKNVNRRSHIEIDNLSPPTKPTNNLDRSQVASAIFDILKY